MGRKKLVRKAEPPSTRESRWRRRIGFRGKTLWNWLELLIVPFMLVVIGLVFAWQQDARNQRIENQRAEAERELAEQRAQDEALQAYLDQMSTLMLEKDLRTSVEDSEVRTLARARTLTVLGRLDPSRKTEVMQFLVEAKLVQRVEGRRPIISLRGANLSYADLRLDDLSGAYLDETDLSYADLGPADLSDAHLVRAYLRGADLSGADMSDAFLFDADLRKADLHQTDLSYADLSYADLGPADLSSAYLVDANLSYADLRKADLSGAYLNEADLSYADLSGAKGWGWNVVQSSEAESLEGATMPNGQKYEDWLKSKDSNGDGKKDGSS